MASKLIHKIQNNSTAPKETYRLPKQFGYWISRMGFRDELPRSRFAGLHWKGFGHYWRINCYGVLEVSEHMSTFDRWANSSHNIGCDVRMIKTERDAIRVVTQLLTNERSRALESHDYT